MPLLSLLFTQNSKEAEREALLGELRRTPGVIGASRLIEGSDDALISRMAMVEILSDIPASTLARLRQPPNVESANEPAARYSA